MDGTSAVYLLVGMGVVSLVPGILIFFIKRNLSASDEAKAAAQLEKDKGHTDALNGLGSRVTTAEGRLRELELGMAEKIGRAEFQEVIREFSAKIDSFHTDINKLFRSGKRDEE